MQYLLRFYPKNPKISINPFTGILHNCEVLLVKLEQILQLKVGCPNFGPVRDSAIYPTESSQHDTDIDFHSVDKDDFSQATRHASDTLIII